MSPDGLVLGAAIVGWMAVALLCGIMIGKGMVRVPVRPPQAEVWLPQMEEVPLDEEGNPVEPPKTKTRVAETSHQQWSDETVDAGVMSLLREYRAAGMPVTAAEAREEVMLMLNSENGEMVL